ncbi:MAG: hypothetical protein DRI54_08980 [Bacteroidetes bacterium]|nr:MAG: hypothetical protein DRI54_08980 [Bacteroidota bacterium]
MLKKVLFFFATMLGLLLNASGQASISDTTVFIPYLTISYGLYSPGGDLADRFGLVNYIGLTFTIKTENNMTYGVNGGMYFGNDVKNKDDLLHEMRTNNGDILDDNVKLSEVHFLERGFQVTGEVGKIFHIGKTNYNSGIHLNLGLGYSSNWIRIENQENNIPQLTKETKKYYDRRVGGILLTEYIGYRYFSKKGLANFTAGLEFMQGFNTDLRTYNIDEKAEISNRYLDLYFGFRIGWSILFRKTMSDAYYYD